MIFNATFDSVTKKFSITADGKEVADVLYVSFSNYQRENDSEERKGSMSLETGKRDKENKMSTQQIIYASKADVDPSLVKESTDFPGLYEIDPAVVGIARLLSKKGK